MTLKNKVKKVVVLGTGGTIAGTAATASDNLGYTAAQLSVQDVLTAIPGLATVLQGRTLVAEQVAQIDSKDMSFSVWTQLALRVQHHLAQPDVLPQADYELLRYALVLGRLQAFRPGVASAAGPH